MRERTVTISGASKTFSVTGWRVGWILAPTVLTDAIRKVHDFLTVGAPAPLQEGVAAALDGLDGSFYDGLATSYRQKRDLLYGALSDAGFRCLPPEVPTTFWPTSQTSRRFIRRRKGSTTLVSAYGSPGRSV